MRIAQVLNLMNSGGIEQVIINYYRHIDRSAVQFDFFVDIDSTIPYRNELESLGAKFYLTPHVSQVTDYQKFLENVFKINKYQIVHVHQSCLSAFALRAAKRAGIPVRICHNHTTASWAEGIKTPAKYFLRPFCKLYATDYFACSEYAAKWMFGKDFNRTFILPNDIESSGYIFSKEYRDEIRREFCIDEDSFVIGHIGRFEKQKNHEFLVGVFAEVKKIETCMSKNSILLLVGEGNRLETIKGLVKRLGLEQWVIFAGVRKDAYKLYSAMDVFCLPSLYEGMPVVLKEAVVNGLPVFLSSNIHYQQSYAKSVECFSLRNSRKDILADKILRSKRSDSVSNAYVDDMDEAAGKLQDKYMKLCGLQI